MTERKPEVPGGEDKVTPEEVVGEATPSPAGREKETAPEVVEVLQEFRVIFEEFKKGAKTLMELGFNPDEIESELNRVAREAGMPAGFTIEVTIGDKEGMTVRLNKES